MGLVANVARRGGVYWWRGRIGLGPQSSRLIARSLRTRDPALARMLGSQITGMATLLRQRVRDGRMTTEQAEDEIGAFLDQEPFAVAPTVFERLEADQASTVTRTPPVSLAYSADQEAAMVADFIRRTGQVLERRAEEVRTRPPLVLAGVASDWIAEATHSGRVQSEACYLLALSGTSARVRPDHSAVLAVAGFSAEEIGDIDRMARQYAPGEATSDWLIGPARDVIVFHLQAAGAIPTIQNVARFRQTALFVLADLLRAYVGRFHRAPDRATTAATGGLHADAGPRAPTPNHGASSPAVSEAVVTHDKSARVSVPTSVSFTAKVEELIRGKTQRKSREWTDKTAQQHRSIAKLFVKNAKTDDPGLMTQEHIGGYLNLLRIIPTHYGKSASDAERSIDEILARAEDLDDDEIGLAPPTINRHRTQLGNILDYMEENGFLIGTITKKSHVRDKTSPEDKRTAFEMADGVQIMRIVDEQSRKGGQIDPAALFWVVLLAWCLALRLSEAAGLALDDIDLDLGLIHIRDNGLRRVKTLASRRTLPIPAEFLRLGFRDLVAKRQADGSNHLFPGLFSQKNRLCSRVSKNVGARPR